MTNTPTDRETVKRYAPTEKDISELAWKIAVNMEVHAAIGTTTKKKAEDVAESIRSALTQAALEAHDKRVKPTNVRENSREEIIDTIEEIIGETHDIDVTDRRYAENIVAWLERHHPAALSALEQPATPHET